MFSGADINHSLLSRAAKIADAHVFNNLIDFKTNPRTNQKSSGRCWLFATTNVLRYEVMKKLNLSEFELSQVLYFHYIFLSHIECFLVLSVLLG